VWCAGDLAGGILERDELAPAGQQNRIVERAPLTRVRHLGRAAFEHSQRPVNAEQPDDGGLVDPVRIAHALASRINLRGRPCGSIGARQACYASAMTPA
jgi:hypothetical protein